jgi:DNA-binding CsgD family transcriptional regulator
VIAGQVAIDTSVWSPIAYLSLIQDFEDLYKMTNTIIIDKNALNSSGQFKFNVSYLPEEDVLLRIHFSKKGDPPASLIIGGKDENHFFLIANRNSQIIINDTCNSEFIKGIKVYGYAPNQVLQKINEIAGYIDTTSFNGSPVKVELIHNAIFEKLRLIADTCSNPIASLYALYRSRYEDNYSLNPDYYKNYLSKWNNTNSKYFQNFRKKVGESGVRTPIPHILSNMISLLVGFLVCLVFIKVTRKKKNPIYELSQQERKVFALILEGKSNKEISVILSIGLSTVKSHINSIYSKLGIGSRKEMLNLNIGQQREII